MSSAPVMEIRNLRKLFPVSRGALQGQKRMVHAVDGVDLVLGRGEMLAIAGESGCGKSTLALTLMGLEKPTEGTIWFEGEDVTNFTGANQKALRRHIQMIFQDPYESLNPLMTVRQIVAEPLEVHHMANDPAEREERVRKAMEDAGLHPPEIYLDRLPHELSGGQRQRVVAAGALVLEPAVLLADEPVSMLDVSIRAEILNLLADLRAKRGISILFITHDLATAACICDRIAVMYLGRIVETGPTLEVLKHPAHPYTQALITVIPIPNPRHKKDRIVLKGAPPNAIEVPSGCRFHPRCPVAFERCPLEDPKLESVTGSHLAACHLVNH